MWFKQQGNYVLFKSLTKLGHKVMWAWWILRQLSLWLSVHYLLQWSRAKFVYFITFSKLIGISMFKNQLESFHSSFCYFSFGILDVLWIFVGLLSPNKAKFWNILLIGLCNKWGLGLSGLLLCIQVVSPWTFPGGSDVKESACSEGDIGLIP